MLPNELAEYAFDAYFRLFPQDKTQEFGRQNPQLKELYLKHANTALEKAAGDRELAMYYMGCYFSHEVAAHTISLRAGLREIIDRAEKTISASKAMIDY